MGRTSPTSSSGEKTLSVAEALKILRPALSGLVAAHEAGVVHRDLKPANIMVEPATGESYIMDFGIAKADDTIDPETLEGRRARSAKALASDSGETAAGGIVGTLQYMAPEQMSAGKDVDQRADIYAFGLIFYDLLVGRRRIEKAASAISEFHGRVETGAAGAAFHRRGHPRAHRRDRFALSRSRPQRPIPDLSRISRGARSSR